MLQENAEMKKVFFEGRTERERERGGERQKKSVLSVWRREENAFFFSRVRCWLGRLPPPPHASHEEEGGIIGLRGRRGRGGGNLY